MARRGGPTDDEIVRRLDRLWNDAYLRNDRSALAEVLADDFRGTFPDGRSIGKAELMQPTPPHPVELSEPSFERFGPTAIARGRIRVEHPEGPTEQRFVRIYTKRRNRWQAVAVHVFPTEPTAKNQPSGGCKRGRKGSRSGAE